ncbi:MAG: 1-deoxy-D-xylulose-5-phosphate synthase [Bacteroidales bacterium]|nr:1-deoxy-D-xylulose-5-phosphate synthase [Bacteroidales bacterium]MBP5517368.1 1-deoxy-D-xylulose-5-phosphate synthase [Bacteroidales bacterium]
MEFRLLDKIDSPADIKSLNVRQLETLCEEIREYMIECCATNPGHLGASLGSVELAVALHYVFNTPEDKIVWDVGHQAYAHKIITGRREQFKLNRKKDGLSGFPKMSESPYDSFGAGHASTSVSAALGLATAAKLQGKDNKVVAVLGDGAFSGGLAYEGMNNAGAAGTDLLVILNDNQIAIDENVGAMHNYLLKMSTSKTYNSMKNKIWGFLGNGWLRRSLQKAVISTKNYFFKHSTIFSGMGFRYFGIIDGNNISDLVGTINRIKNFKGPKLLHIRTVKGKGYKPAEENQSIWHAPGKFDIETGERIRSEGAPLKYQNIFGQTIVKLAEKDSRIVGITPAMLSGGQLSDMMKAFPERTFDVGIAEEHAVTFSAGLAADGMLPFCNVYSSFLQRGFDQIIHDVALQNLKVIFTIDRAGLVGEDGATHQGAFDLSYLRIIPNLTEMAPIDEIEMQDMIYSATLDEYTGPISIRYPRGNCQGLELPEEFSKIEKGKAVKLRQGSEIAVLSIGTIGNQVKKAIEMLGDEASKVSHYNMRFLRPLDTAAVEEAAAGHKAIITVEDGSVVGGLYGAVCETLADKNTMCSVVGLGIPDRFIEQGTVAQQLSECGIDAESICKAIRYFF